jgi:hypothetical protein
MIVDVRVGRQKCQSHIMQENVSVYCNLSQIIDVCRISAFCVTHSHKQLIKRHVETL